MVITYTNGFSQENIIFDHLSCCEDNFIPPLGTRVELQAYARKIAKRAECFEAWAEGELVGLAAAYCNDYKRNIAFITSVSVVREWQGKGIASKLLSNCICSVRKLGFVSLELDVHEMNKAASKLYEKYGFTTASHCKSIQKMKINIKEIEMP